MIQVCETCKRRFSWEPWTVRNTGTNRTWYFCSETCSNTFMDERNKKRREEAKREREELYKQEEEELRKSIEEDQKSWTTFLKNQEQKELRKRRELEQKETSLKNNQAKGITEDELIFSHDKKIIYGFVEGIEHAVIPDSVIEIAYKAFYNCETLKSVIIPKSVKTIEVQAFDGCSMLEEVKILPGVTKLDECVFYGCSSLKNITIPETVKEVERNCFQGCSSIETAEIHSSLIGKEMFYNCRNLKNVKIGKEVVRIYRDAFSGCSSIVSLTIPQTVKNIKDLSLCGCYSLKTLTILGDLKEICGTDRLFGLISSAGEKSFVGRKIEKLNPKLETLTIPSTVEYISPDKKFPITLKTINIAGGKLSSKVKKNLKLALKKRHLGNVKINEKVPFSNFESADEKFYTNENKKSSEAINKESKINSTFEKIKDKTGSAIDKLKENENVQDTLEITKDALGKVTGSLKDSFKNLFGK